MGNFSIIEGQWKGKFNFRKVQPEDWDKVIKHIQDHFLRDEPTSQLLGYTDEYGEEFAALVRMLLPHDLSFWVEDIETGEVAGVRVTFRQNKDTSFAGLSMNSRALKVLYQLVVMCNEKCDLLEHYKVDEYANFFVASCAPKYRNMGITSEMYRRSIKFLQSEGFKMAKSCFTSIYTRKAATNLGFEEVCRVYYRDMMDDEGNPIFDEAGLTEENYGANMCKLL